MAAEPTSLAGIKHARQCDGEDGGSAAKRQAGHAVGSKEAFLDVYESLKKEVLNEILPPYGLPKEVAEYQAEILDYNVPGGKLNRGLSVVHALQSIRGGTLTKDEARQASILGWCIEWLQAFFLVADDVMDASPTRRGQPCWYKLSKVGMIAINDSFLLQSHLYKFLMRHFKGQACYVQLLELFIETTWQTELGQQMDLTSAPLPGSGAAVDLDRFTLERYRGIVKHKTAFYSFYLPIACALVLAGETDEAVFAASQAILVEMGEYFQVQDDVLDAFAPPEVLGKVGTDIQDSKCSWLVVQSLARATAAQRALLREHYGRHDEASVAAVKALYVEQGLQAAYEQYEDGVYASLRARIAVACAATGGRVPEEVFLSLLHKIYRRHK